MDDGRDPTHILSVSFLLMTIMRTSSRTLLLSILSSVALSSAQNTARILLYTATADFRHDSIPTAIQALHNSSAKYNVQFDATEDMTKFNDENLALYDALMFVSTTGEGQPPIYTVHSPGPHHVPPRIMTEISRSP